MKWLRMPVVGLLIVGLSQLSGCAFAVGAAVGGAAGYILKDKGYTVQSPIEKRRPTLETRD